MAQGLNSTKTPARPSHEAIETKVGTDVLTDRTKEQKMDQIANQAAKRATNRIHANEENIPGSTIFSK
jgi:hypothetical protein